MNAYAASVLATGRQLAQRHVPLDELIATAHLLEEAAQAVFPKNPPPSMAVYNKFDKLSHISVFLLVGAYSRTQSAAAATRIDALELEARVLPAEERTRFYGLVGQSPAMREIYRRIETVTHSRDPLLVVGEPGAGKELVARAIHECGAHRSSPFVVLRCRAVPGYLIENELFGYRRQGTDGAQTYLGLYGAAEGGTLFLDEMTSLPMDVQDRLASTMGGPQANGSGAVRILASTSRDPEEASRVGQMRKDCARLFAERVWRIPPLRERREDIALLARHFVDLLNYRTVRNTAVAGIDAAALEVLEHYPWPGNVRELFEAIRCAFALTRSTLIGPADLPAAISGINGQNRHLPTISFETFADAEREVLKRALEMTGGNKLRAARLLKISRKKLYSGIAKYGLKAADA
jgi:DNA-binding NtrC family response regulator